MTDDEHRAAADEAPKPHGIARVIPLRGEWWGDDGPSREQIEEAFQHRHDLRLALAAWLVHRVHKQACLVLRPIAIRYRRDLRTEAADFAQEVLTELFKRQGRILRMWDPRRGRSLSSFLSLLMQRWIYRSMRRKAAPWSDEAFAYAETIAAVDDSGVSDCGSFVEDIELRLRLDAVLDRMQAELSTRDWQRFVALFIKQLSPAEVARSENLSENAMHRWMARLRQRTRDLFNEDTTPRDE